MKKFKKFLEKNKVYIIIGVLAVLFIVLSLLVKDSDIKNKNDEKVTEWYSTTKEGGVVVTVLAQTTCGHCLNFKPIMNSVQKEYGFKLYCLLIHMIFILVLVHLISLLLIMENLLLTIKEVKCLKMS